MIYLHCEGGDKSAPRCVRFQFGDSFCLQACTLKKETKIDTWQLIQNARCEQVRLSRFFFLMTTNHWPVINVNYYYSVILQSAHGAAPWGEELVPINQKVQTEQVCQVPLWGTIGLQACPKPIVVNSGQQQSPC